MYVIKIIQIYYIFLTLFMVLVVNSTTLNFVNAWPGVLLMWINFLAFYIGFIRMRNKKKANFLENYSVTLLAGKRKFFIAIIAIIFSTRVVEFYTGQTIISAISNLLNGKSLYFLYQNYFLENELGSFSFMKLPYIFMMFYLKLLLVYSFVALFVLKKITTKGEKFFLVVISLSFIFVGISRGTNFEFFEFLLLIIYVIVSRNSFGINSRINIRVLFPIFFFGACFISLFSQIIFARGYVGYYITNEIQYNPDALFSRISPGLSLLISSLTGYFGFGISYTSVFINKIWLGSFDNFLAGFIPLGFKLTGIASVQNNMKELIDLGVAWIPDVSTLINNFGFIGVFIICFTLGRFLSYINSDKSVGDYMLINITNYMIMIQMVSLPVGNFIIISSANKLIVLLLSSVWLWKCFKKNIEKV